MEEQKNVMNNHKVLQHANFSDVASVDGFLLVLKQKPVLPKSYWSIEPSIY